MWVPAALLEAIGGLIALRNWMQLSERKRLPQPKRRAPARRPGQVAPRPGAGVGASPDMNEPKPGH